MAQVLQKEILGLAISVYLPYIGGMAKTLSTKELKRLLTGLESQGCRIRDARSGYLVLHPNGKDSFTMHLTLSDSRGMKNLRSDMRRTGLDWPLD